MSDYGIKIAKQGSNTDSSSIDDYTFWSKYRTLPFLFKASITINANSGSCNGTEIYTHNLGFKPLVEGFVTTRSAGRQGIPVTVDQTGVKFDCGGDNLEETFGMKIKDNTVEVTYDISCIIPMFGSRCIDISVSYTVDLYFYMYELGS